MSLLSTIACNNKGHIYTNCAMFLSTGRTTGAAEKCRWCWSGNQQCSRFLFLLYTTIVILIVITFKGAVWDFIQSPLCAVNHLQHVHSSGPGMTMCKSCAACWLLFMCTMSCYMWYEGTAQLLSLTEFKSHLFELYIIGWTINRWTICLCLLCLLVWLVLWFRLRLSAQFSGWNVWSSPVRDTFHIAATAAEHPLATLWLCKAAWAGQCRRMCSGVSDPVPHECSWMWEVLSWLSYFCMWQFKR